MMGVPKSVALGNIPHAVPMFLKADTIQWLDAIAKKLSEQRKCDVSRSDAVEYLTLRHWKKTKTRIMEQQADRSNALAKSALKLR